MAGILDPLQADYPMHFLVDRVAPDLRGTADTLNREGLMLNTTTYTAEDLPSATLPEAYGVGVIQTSGDPFSFELGNQLVSVDRAAPPYDQFYGVDMAVADLRDDMMDVEPILSAPLIGFPSVIFNFAHVIRSRTNGETTYDSGSPTDSVDPSVDIRAILDSEWMDFVVAHHESLQGATRRSLLLSASATFNDVEWASDFIVHNPPDALKTHVETLVDTCSRLGLDKEEGEEEGKEEEGSKKAKKKKKKGKSKAKKEEETAADRVKKRLAMLVAHHPDIRTSIKSEKTTLGLQLESQFCFNWDVTFGKRDMLGFKKCFTAGDVQDAVNDACTTGAAVHHIEVVPVKLKKTVTKYTHFSLGGSGQPLPLSSCRIAMEVLQRFRAFDKLRAKGYPSRLADQVEVELTPEEQAIKDNAPPFRTSKGVVFCTLEGGEHETYVLDWQGEPLLASTHNWVKSIHDQPRSSGVVSSFYEEQKDLKPFAPGDLMWRLIILPLALMTACLYVIREFPQEYLDGMKGKEVLKLSEKMVLVFQAKILKAEAAIKAWFNRKAPQYELLRHRLLAILRDVTRPTDAFVAYDLIGPVWTSTADHLAYSQSYTSRRISKGKGPSTPSLLETLTVVSDRDLATTLALFGSIRKPVAEVASQVEPSSAAQAEVSSAAQAEVSSAAQAGASSAAQAEATLPAQVEASAAVQVAHSAA